MSATRLVPSSDRKSTLGGGSVRKGAVIALCLAAFGLGGCSNMSASEQRMLSGGALGTAGGAAIGAMTGGSALMGGVIGAAAGVGAGYLYDQSKK